MDDTLAEHPAQMMLMCGRCHAERLEASPPEATCVYCDLEIDHWDTSLCDDCLDEERFIPGHGGEEYADRYNALHRNSRPPRDELGG